MKSSLVLRAQEIINGSADGMTTKDAMKRAILERYADDPQGMAEAFASFAQSSMKGLRKRTYEMTDATQLALFATPAVIGVRTKDGDLLVPREQAHAGHIRQWQKEGQQHHATQHLRFTRFGEELKLIKDVPDETPWESARRMLPVAESSEDDG